MFEKKKYQESLGKLRALQSVKEEEFKRQMENQLEIARTKEQYLFELSNEKELAIMREKTKQEFFLKAEQERLNSRNLYEMKREEENARQMEHLYEIQAEVLQRNERNSTPRHDTRGEARGNERIETPKYEVQGEGMTEE